MLPISKIEIISSIIFEEKTIDGDFWLLLLIENIIKIVTLILFNIKIRQANGVLRFNWSDFMYKK